MRKIARVAWKDTLVRFSSRSEILFFIVLPVLFTFILGGGFGQGNAEVDNRVPVLVVDEDGGALAGELRDALAASGVVRPEVADRSTAEAHFADDAVPALLVIPAGFQQTLLAGEPVELVVRTVQGSANALISEQAIQTAIGSVSRTVQAASSSVEAAASIRAFADEQERAEYFLGAQALAREHLDATPDRVEVTRPSGSVEAAAGLNNAAQQSAGQLITWVFIPLLGTSGLFAYERTGGTLRRLLTTPTGKATLLLGTISGQLGIALVQMLILVLFGSLVMGLNWGHAPAALALMLVTFGLAAVAMGTMLGTFVRSESQANGLSTMLGMTMALLGGCWFPLEVFPPAARTFSMILPTRWAMQGLSDIVMRGRGLAEVLPEATILFGFTVVFFAIGTWRFHYE
jgi:ABC-2 type transport system permease protein